MVLAWLLFGTLCSPSSALPRGHNWTKLNSQERKNDDDDDFIVQNYEVKYIKKRKQMQITHTFHIHN